MFCNFVGKNKIPKLQIMTRNYQYKRITMTIAALVFIALITFAANQSEMKFRRIDTRNGLSNSQANCVLKDSRGYV